MDRLARRIARWLAPWLAEAFDTHLRRHGGAWLLSQPRVFGDPARLSIASDAVVNDALFNLSSGRIEIGPAVFLGHDVLLLTGTHDIAARGLDRQRAVPSEGRDIVIEEGAWIASRATVLGPCRIGAHAVVAAGALVRGDVPAGAVVAGSPARVVKRVP